MYWINFVSLFFHGHFLLLPEYLRLLLIFLSHRDTVCIGFIQNLSLALAEYLSERLSGNLMLLNRQTNTIFNFKTFHNTFTELYHYVYLWWFFILVVINLQCDISSFTFVFACIIFIMFCNTDVVMICKCKTNNAGNKFMRWMVKIIVLSQVR